VDALKALGPYDKGEHERNALAQPILHLAMSGDPYRTVLRSSTVSNTKLIVQIQRLPANASGYLQ
jgi:hypothetical protein